MVLIPHGGCLGGKVCSAYEMVLLELHAIVEAGEQQMTVNLARSCLEAEGDVNYSTYNAAQGRGNSHFQKDQKLKMKAENC